MDKTKELFEEYGLRWRYAGPFVLEKEELKYYVQLWADKGWGTSRLWQFANIKVYFEIEDLNKFMDKTIQDKQTQSVWMHFKEGLTMEYSSFFQNYNLLVDRDEIIGKVLSNPNLLYEMLPEVKMMESFGKKIDGKEAIKMISNKINRTKYEIDEKLEVLAEELKIEINKIYEEERAH